MGGPFLNPLLQECSGIRFEKSTGICIPGGRNRSCHRHTFRDDELKFPLEGRADAQHGDRTFFDLELYSCTKPRLPVIFLQASKYGLTLCDGHIVRSVMAYK